MNREDALMLVEKISQSSEDDEMAHAYEDSLMLRFIEDIALRDDELGEIARIILTTREINFARWCS
jgi:hypothetical protein